MGVAVQVVEVEEAYSQTQDPDSDRPAVVAVAVCTPLSRLVSVADQVAVVVSRYQPCEIPPRFVATKVIMKISPTKKRTPPAMLQMSVIFEKNPPAGRI